MVEDNCPKRCPCCYRKNSKARLEHWFSDCYLFQEFRMKHFADIEFLFGKICVMSKICPISNSNINTDVTNINNIESGTDSSNSMNSDNNSNSNSDGISSNNNSIVRENRNSIISENRNSNISDSENNSIVTNNIVNNINGDNRVDISNFLNNECVNINVIRGTSI